MEAEENVALATCTAQGERPFYYYCGDKAKPAVHAVMGRGIRVLPHARVGFQVVANNAGEVV